jgi:flagellar motor switch protein FliG
MSLNSAMALTGARKAAILISLLGDEPAAAILRNLPSEDLHRITDEVANLPSVPTDVTYEVLEEFQELMVAQDFIAAGGRDVASRLLIKAFGETGAKSMVQRLMHPDETSSHQMDSLRKLDTKKLARFLVGEHSQTKALILGQLDAKQASVLLMKLEPEARADCVRRLANLGPLSPQVAAKVSTVLNRRLRPATDQAARESSGFRDVADLLNRLDPVAAREILEDIERDEPKLDQMFTFDDFLEVSEQDLRELMNSIDKKTLIIAMKGAREDLRSHFYRTMSSRAVDMMKEDSDAMGPVRNKDVVKAQSEIIAIARKLESEGKIALKSEGEDEYVL